MLPATSAGALELAMPQISAGHAPDLPSMTATEAAAGPARGSVNGLTSLGVEPTASVLQPEAAAGAEGAGGTPGGGAATAWGATLGWDAPITDAADMPAATGSGWGVTTTQVRRSLRQFRRSLRVYSGRWKEVSEKRYHKHNSTSFHTCSLVDYSGSKSSCKVRDHVNMAENVEMTVTMITCAG